MEIAPPEPVTLFNDTSGQNVTALLKKKKKKIREGGNALSEGCVCVFCIHLPRNLPLPTLYTHTHTHSPSSPMSASVLWVVSCGLKSGKVAY